MNNRIQNRRQQQRGRLFTIVVVVVILLIVAVLTTMMWVSGRNGTSEARSDAESGAKGRTSSQTAEKSFIVYDGKKYVYNDKLNNYLLLGVDTRGSIQEVKEPGKAGQSDSIFLISYDRVAESTVGLAIPRDTITQIETFTPDGESTGFSADHLTLQYAYGEGGRKSCELTSAAVSRLLSGLPINGYAAINLDSIPKLTQLLGGVEVTVPDDSLTEKDPAFLKGNKVVLNEDNTELFVRSRDIKVEQSAINRMNRQKVFLESFADKLAREQKKDASTVTKLFETMKPEMVTNMSNDIFVDIAMAKRIGGVQTIPGETGHEGVYDVYRVDESALYQMILELFYEEAKTE